jgi:serine/threonine-protein kinase
MAPEQIRGDAVDGRTDQFAWGVCAYELLGGRIPWKVEAGSLGAVASILTDAPPDLGGLVPGLPAGVVATIERALSKKPEARFASMRELIDEIEAHLEDAPRGSAPPAGRATPAPSTPAAPAREAEDLRRYSTGEMRDILQRAMDREAERGTGFTRQELVEAAREVGVDEKAIEAALSEAETVRNAPAELAERRKRARLAFYRHLVSYIVVNCMLALMTGHFLKPVLAGWGIGVLLHLMNVLIPKDDEKKKKRKRKDDERGRARSHREERELDAAVETLVHVTTARKARLRIAAPAPRVSSGQERTGDTGRAEREAEAAAEADAARRHMEKKRP